MTDLTARSRAGFAFIAGTALMGVSGVAIADTVTYAYDEQGRVVSAIYSDGVTVTYTYDAAGNRTQFIAQPANHNPTAVGDAAGTHISTAATVNPLTNDSDTDGDPIHITSVGSAAHGSAIINGGGPTVTYTPASAYSGADSFSYIIADNRGGTASSTVSMTVSGANVAPVAVADELDLTDPSHTGAGGSINVLANDTDADGDTLSITSVSPSSFGTTTIQGGGYIQYITTSGLATHDNFTYIITDGHGNSATAGVHVAIDISS